MSKNQLDKALRKARQRDKKRHTKMKVTGKSVFTLAKKVS